MSRPDRSYRKIAEERIDLLYGFAREAFGENRSLANRYVEIARRIGTRCRVRIPKELKRLTCKKCGALLVPGTNCRVRIRPDRGTTVTVTCLNCRNIKRYPVIKTSFTGKLARGSDPPHHLTGKYE